MLAMQPYCRISRITSDGGRSYLLWHGTSVAGSSAVGFALSTSTPATLVRIAASRGAPQLRQSHLVKATTDELFLELQEQQLLLEDSLLWPDLGIADRTSSLSPARPSSAPLAVVSDVLDASKRSTNSRKSIALTTEALRPQRVSSPVIARMLRSTTSIQVMWSGMNEAMSLQCWFPSCVCRLGG